MFVNATDSGDWIASELDVGDIEDAFWSEAISFADEFCKRFGPITHRFRADLNWIDCIAKDASQNRDQTGDRSDGFEWRAVRLQEKRVWIGHKQRRWRKHVGRRF